VCGRDYEGRVKSIKFANRAEFAAAIAAGMFQGSATHVLVLHDPACTPTGCNCEPEFIVEDLTVENYVAGQRAQADWVRSTRS
jgi:hypothetical protein